MNEQEQRIAIAKACGWKREVSLNKDFDYVWKRDSEYFFALPDYVNDLNDIREAIQSQPVSIQKAMRAEVWRLSSQMDVLPEAKVFAEALLRVLGKWVESELVST